MRLPISLCIAVVCLLDVAACGKPKFKNETFHCYKLTEKTVTPSKYELDLSFDSLDTKVYKGEVNIDLNIGEADSKVNPQETSKTCRTRGALDEIVLHADTSLDIDKIQLTQGEPGCFRRNHIAIKDLYRDHKKQLIKIKLKRELKANAEARLHISFRGRMGTDNVGVYVSQHNSGSQVYKQIVSEFRPAFTRTVFPCFDEGHFRVPFKLTLHHPKELTAYSNTNGESEHKKFAKLASTKFEETKPMPIYMVAFTVGQFDEPLETTVKRSKGEGDAKIRVITAPGKRDTGKFALDMAKESLEWFQEYINYPFPIDKFDIMAFADLDKDNVESWGLAYVRDTKIWIDDETRNDTRITTAINVAHVVVHQWFGNLISVVDWRDIWITESVAANMAFKFAERQYPLQAEFLVRIGILSQVMQSDQTGQMHAVSPPAEKMVTPSEIYAIVDILEFTKSASAGQKLIEYVGEGKYQEWLQKLVSDYAYRTIPSGIHKKLLQDQQELLMALDSFVENPGLQLVSAEIKDNSIRLSAEPYNKTSESGSGQSKPAFCVKAGLFDGPFNLEETVCGMPKQIELTDEWFQKINAGDQVYFELQPNPSVSAYFRARYSDDLLEMLVKAIEQKKLAPMDQIKLLDDANNLVQAKLIKPESFAKLVAAHKDVSDSAVLIELLVVSKTLKSLGLESPLTQTFLKVFAEHGFEVTGKETLLEQRARQEILKALVALQVKPVVTAAVKAFSKSERLAPFLREPVYAAVVQSNSLEQSQSLLVKLQRTSSYEEKIRLITALAGSKDEDLLFDLKFWLERSGLKADIIKPFLATIDATLASLKSKE